MAIKTYYISKLGRDFQVSPHFKLREFQSRDGADKVLVSEELLAKLEEARAYGGFTITVNSGYRSAAHNKKVGGATNSNHTKGLAADVVFMKDGKVVSAKLICCLCQALGINGVAYISDKAVHLDVASRTYRGDERNGYGNNVGGDFYRYFGITKAQIEALRVRQEVEKPPKKEEAKMTQEQFNLMMNKWIAEQAAKDPGEWSKDAREWAEKEGIILGTGAGNSYQAPCTREQMIEFLYRLAKKIDPVK